MMNSLLVTLCLTGLVNEVLCYQVVPLSNTRQHRTTRVSSSTSLASTSPLFTSTSTGRSSSTRRTFKQLRVPIVSSLVDSNKFSNTFSNNQNNLNRDSGKLFSTAVPVETESATANDEGNNDEGIGAWIPLASVDSLKGLGPQRITTMNVDFVVWHTPVEDKKLKKMRGKDLQWVVQADACSHRLAPLSQGRIDPKSGCIECPYHGWQFDTEGNVTAIPQLDDGTTIENIQKKSSTRVQTFPVHVAGGMLFAFLPSSLHGEMFQQSLLPEEYYPFLNESKDASVYVRDLPYSFDFLVENFMDPAHIPFAHHKLQSTRDDGMPVEMKELESNFTHVVLTFKDMTSNRRRDAYMSFQRPSFYHFSEKKGELDEKTGTREGDYEVTLPIFLAPISAGKCRVFLKTPSLKIPDWLLHLGSNRFLNSDIWLHDTEREVIRRKESMPEMSSKKLSGMDYNYQTTSDLGVSSFRRWWEKHGFADSPPHTFGMSTMKQLGPTSLSREEQIDPWENHSKHCTICRGALVNMKRAQTASLFFAALSAIFGRRKPLLAIVGAGLGILGHNFFKKFATALEGNPYSSGIDDRSVAASSD